MQFFQHNIHYAPYWGSQMKPFFILARSPQVVVRAIKVAFVVGTALTVINRGTG